MVQRSTRRHPLTVFLVPDVSDSGPPVWPPIPDPQSESLTYDLAIVPMSSIALVTRLTQKLDFDAIVEGHSIKAMTAGLSEAPAIIKQVLPDPLEQEADWSKVRSLEFVELLQEREALLDERNRLPVGSEEDFAEQIKAIHGYRTLEDKVAR